MDWFQKRFIKGTERGGVIRGVVVFFEVKKTLRCGGFLFTDDCWSQFVVSAIFSATTLKSNPPDMPWALYPFLDSL